MSRKATESRDLANRAQLAHENGEYRRATRLLAKAIEVDPSNADLHRKLGHAHLANGNFAAAVEELRYSASAVPDNADIYAELAEAYFGQGDDQQAVAAIENALDRDSSHVAALSLQAKLLERQERIVDAEKVYHRILDLDRNNTHAKLRLALARLRLSQPDQAAPLLRAVCQCPQTSPGERAEARWALGIAYGRIGRWEESSDNLAAALPHLKRPTANEWYRLAYAQQRSGDRSGARLNLSRSLQIDPRHQGAIQLAEQTRLLPASPTDSEQPIRYAAAQFSPDTNRPAGSPASGYR